MFWRGGFGKNFVPFVPKMFSVKGPFFNPKDLNQISYRLPQPYRVPIGPNFQGGSPKILTPKSLKFHFEFLPGLATFGKS